MSSNGSFSYTSIFITCMFILLVTNLFYYSTGQAIDLSSLSLTSLTVFLPMVLAVIIASGIKVFNTGISDVAVKMILGIGALINILFKFDVFGLPVGIGLLTNVYTILGSGDVLGLSLIVSTVLAVTTFFSGVMILINSA